MTPVTLNNGRPAARKHAGEAPARPRTDNRFRALLGDPAWNSLPPAVRRRFSTPLVPNEPRLYRGTVVETVHSPLGRIVANLARIAGSPLPLTPGATGPATVMVTENAALGGQVWTRIYARPGKFPQTINSAKRFGGRTGLEELLGPWRGLGFVMTLKLSVISNALVFDSAGYSVLIGNFRVPLPAWLSPGHCRITHRDIGHGRFTFTLELTHPWFGLLCRQDAEFADVVPAHTPESSQ